MTEPPTTRSNEPTPRELDAHVDTLVTRQMATSHIPGLALIIIRDGEVVLAKGYGTTGADQPVTIDTPFVLGSTSKQLTGLAVQRLVAEGRIDLDAPVHSLLPSFGSGSDSTARITTRMLLGQTSGLAASTSRTGWDSSSGHHDSLQQNAKRLGTLPLERQPGTSFEYADANYDLLGAVIEAASGQSFDAFLRDQVLAPLGMTHTYANLATAREAGLPDGYYRWFGLWNAATKLPYARSAIPSGYIVSTARDQASLLSARVHERPVDGAMASALSASLKPMSRADQWSSYASGWFVHPFWPSRPPGSPGTEPGVPLMYEHGGTAITFRSYLAFSETAHYGIVVLTNRDDEINPSDFEIFTDQLTRTALGTRFPPYRTNEGIIRRYSSALLLGLPLLQVTALLMLVRARRRIAVTVALTSALFFSAISLLLFLVYVPAQSTLPLLATWQTLPDIATVTAVCIALTMLLVAVIWARVRRHRLSTAKPTLGEPPAVLG